MKDKPDEITEEYVQKLMSLTDEKTSKPFLENLYQLPESKFKTLGKLPVSLSGVGGQ